MLNDITKKLIKQKRKQLRLTIQLNKWLRLAQMKSPAKKALYYLTAISFKTYLRLVCEITLFSLMVQCLIDIKNDPYNILSAQASFQAIAIFAYFFVIFMLESQNLNQIIDISYIANENTKLKGLLTQQVSLVSELTEKYEKIKKEQGVSSNNDT